MPHLKHPARVEPYALVPERCSKKNQLMLELVFKRHRKAVYGKSAPSFSTTVGIKSSRLAPITTAKALAI